MAERLRAWLAGGHECDLDLGEGSAQELWRRSRTPAIAVGFRRPTGALVYARARSSGLRSKVGLIGRTTLSSGEAHREGPTCPRADYPSGSMRKTTCGTSTTAKARPKTTPAGRRPRPQPTRSPRPKSAPWSLRNNDLVAHAHHLGQIRPRSSRWLLRPPDRDLCRTTAKTRQRPTPTGGERTTAAAAGLYGARRRIAAPKAAHDVVAPFWLWLSPHSRVSRRAGVSREPAHGRQDREWDHDRSEDDERRRLIAGCGNNIRGSPHEIILHRCVPPAFIFSFSDGRFRSGGRR